MLRKILEGFLLHLNEVGDFEYLVVLGKRHTKSFSEKPLFTISTDHSSQILYALHRGSPARRRRSCGESLSFIYAFVTNKRDSTRIIMQFTIITPFQVVVKTFLRNSLVFLTCSRIKGAAAIDNAAARGYNAYIRYKRKELRERRWQYAEKPGTEEKACFA